MAVLDTCFLIDLERENREAWQLLEVVSARREQLRIPSAVWVEYLASMPPEPRDRAVNELLNAATFEPFSRDLADEATLIQHNLFARGEPLGWHDLQVAATARWHHEPVVTRDTQFARVESLRVLSW